MKVRAACRVVCCLWPVRRRLSLFSGLNPSLLPHSSERPSFSAAPPSPSLSHSSMMKTPLAVFQTADKRSLSPSAFKNERITCLKQQQPSFSTPPPHGTKAIRKHAQHTHTHTHTLLKFPTSCPLATDLPLFLACVVVDSTGRTLTRS